MHLTISPSRACRALAAGMLCALAAAACGDGPVTPREEGTPGLTVVTATAADSVGAVLPQTLVVEVRDAEGRLAAGTPVRFEASRAARPGGGGSVPTAELGAPGASSFQPVATATTDAQGRAAVQVRLGPVPGTAEIAVTVPPLGFSGTARYTVNPGAPARMDVGPLDTAVIVGRSYPLRFQVFDRLDNPVEVAPSVTVAGGNVSRSGFTVTGIAPGRTTLSLSAGSTLRSVSVSVVPAGTLLAAGADGIYMFEMDGSGMRRVTGTGATQPRWFPDGQRFVFSTLRGASGGYGHAKVSDLNGATRNLVQAPGRLIDSEVWAHPSRDGEWVYFGGYDGSAGHPYRVRADGTGLETIPGYVARVAVNEAHPSPSPQGDRVAFFSQGGGPHIVDIRVRSTVTGELLVKDVSGHTPEWSHGDTIAFLDTGWNEAGPIMLMASSGTGVRRLTDRAVYRFGMDWSPDDRWIVGYAADIQRLEVVNVATGHAIPLPYSAGLFTPAWKP